jgi:hypothetical protein
MTQATNFKELAEQIAYKLDSKGQSDILDILETHLRQAYVDGQKSIMTEFIRTFTPEALAEAGIV